MPRSSRAAPGHNDKAQYSEKPQDYVNNVNRLVKKFETARTMVPKPEIQDRPGATAGLLAYGTSHYGTTEARDKLAATFGVSLDYCRLRSLPLHAEAVNWMRRHERIYVVEQNRDGQLVTILRDELPRARHALRVGPPVQRAPPRRDHRDRRSPGRRTRVPGRRLGRAEGRARRMSATPNTPGLPASSAAPASKTNRIGLPKANYEGGKSTLCLGCGHDVITKQIINAFYEMGIEPHKVAKFSGIGCSSKTPAYFLNRAWGFNGVHGRMPSIATGALVADPTLHGIGISGDGDTASIGIGQFVHLVRRNLPLVYIIEDNGVYGLTKGQFSATADLGAKQKGGAVNEFIPIDCCSLAIELGGTFVARSFSGDMKQLQTILEAAIAHKGTSVIDVISPCVTFNDHEGSTKSYKYSKEHETPVHEIGFVPFFEETLAEIPVGDTKDVAFPDGSVLKFRGVGRDYDPTDKEKALKTIHESHGKQEILTGILYIDPSKPSLSETLGSTGEPLTNLPLEKLRPGREALDEIMESLR